MGILNERCCGNHIDIKNIPYCSSFAFALTLPFGCHYYYAQTMNVTLTELEAIIEM